MNDGDKYSDGEFTDVVEESDFSLTKGEAGEDYDRIYTSYFKIPKTDDGDLLKLCLAVRIETFKHDSKKTIKSLCDEVRVKDEEFDRRVRNKQNSVNKILTIEIKSFIKVIDDCRHGDFFTHAKGVLSWLEKKYNETWGSTSKKGLLFVINEKCSQRNFLFNTFLMFRLHDHHVVKSIATVKKSTLLHETLQKKKQQQQQQTKK